MKTILALLTFTIVSTSIIAQDLYAAKESKVVFYSDSPLEKIEGINVKTKTFFKVSTKTLAIVIPVVSFKFEQSLMEEHFNENYMETEKFPTSKFNGTIKEDIDFTKDGTYEATAEGKLTVHGVTKDRIITGTIIVKDGQLIFDGKFNIIIEDHDIKIPTVVAKKIAEEVEVTVHFVYEPKK